MKSLDQMMLRERKGLIAIRYRCVTQDLQVHFGTLGHVLVERCGCVEKFQLAALGVTLTTPDCELDLSELGASAQGSSTTRLAVDEVHELIQWCFGLDVHPWELQLQSVFVQAT